MTACAPGAKSSKWISTTGAGFMYDRDTRETRSSIALQITPGLQPPVYLTARFETPDGERVVERVLASDDLDRRTLALQSPGSADWRAGTYHVVVELYRDAARTQLIDRLRQPSQLPVDLTPGAKQQWSGTVDVDSR